MEICVDSVQSAVNAVAGGATRLELCSCLEVGGVTPSIGLLRRVQEVAADDIPVFVLIRPRPSDLLYTEDEVLVMENDIRAVKDCGAEGIVVGALTSEGEVDIAKMTSLMSVAKPLPVTFHRAIDMCRDPIVALDALLALGCARILTSGQQSTAWHGRHCIKRMVDKVKDKMIIMPGGGITSDNLQEIAEVTGAPEFHASAKVPCGSAMTFCNASVNMGITGEEYQTFVCDTKQVADMVSIVKYHLKSKQTNWCT